MIETELIILRTTPFQDSSLIFQALSESHGRISVLAKGARKISKKSFPTIGLFRIISAHLTEPKSGELYTLKNADLVQVNDNLALYPDLIDYATTIANFTLSCNFNGLECQLFHHCIKECLTNISKRDTPFSSWTVKLIICHLMEQGLFPEVTLSDSQKHVINHILSEDSNLLKS
ncbi:MAG: recombination protein O N-terminal domain-containing protein, partial [Lentisphaeraceae bacterium]|nr:recombination protein O N-terminal domain-containing protein [Lentisphaeraceae bacterium]